MARYWIMRRNRAAVPPRFEFLRSRPTFVPAGTPAPSGLGDLVEGSVSADDRVGGLRWTYQDPTFIATQPGEVSGWRNGREPHDFGGRKAALLASMLDGVSLVAYGDADAEPSAEEQERARKREARKAYRESLAAGKAEAL